MANDDSADFFYLIDHTGTRYVPRMMAARDARYGYPVHPVGKGNDASAADYMEDEKKLVQQVVLHGQGCVLVSKADCRMDRSTRSE
jgi:hypothetical protein